MPAKKMRIEIYDNGDRFTITFEGQVTREKALRLLDFVELLGGMSIVNNKTNNSKFNLTKINKVRLSAKENFPFNWFSSKDIQLAYEKQFNEPIRLSTISTYMSRLTDRGFFMKKNVSNQIRYRNITNIAKYQIHEKS